MTLFALPAEEVAIDEAPVVEDPPAGGDIASDADSENVDEDPLPRYAAALSVPGEEVYVPPGDPIIPLQAAAEAALADFSEPSLAEYLPKEAQPGADAWASVTCAHHSPIRNLNLHMHGKPYAKKLQKKRAGSEVLLQYAIKFLERTFELGGRVAFELPAENQL
eukprot:s2861_g18.t1